MAFQKSRAGKIIGMILAFAFLALGVLFSIGGVSNMVKASKMNASTEGRVTVVEEDTDSRRRNTGTSRRRTSSTECDVTAEFEVQGKMYTTETQAQTKANCQYGEGDSIEIHYSAEDPATSVAGAKGGEWLLLVAGIGMMVGSAAALITGRAVVRTRRS